MKNIAAAGVLERIADLHHRVGSTYRTVEEWRNGNLLKDENAARRLTAESPVAGGKNPDRSGIQPLHSKCSFANYQVQNDGQKYALSQAKSIADELMTGCTNFVFSGKTGTGKNHLAAAMVTADGEGAQRDYRHRV